MDLWSALVFGVTPVLSVLLIFFVKRKFLWVSPLISTAFSAVISIIAMPTILSVQEYRAMFFGVCLPMQLVIVIILTAIAYLAAFLLKRKWKG